ncbi:C-type mannose receptor 2-like, partial [Homarus americanus]|uniref:C-type mannose receptor 2-like n=1 Tax=Homarus americanus TaxID=6706 RepID=UPI001C4979D8
MVARCPKGWQHRGGSDQCFLIHHYGDIRKFSDARSYCKAHGGDLATIDTTTTRDWLALAVAETGDVGQNAYMWVGAKETTEDTWMWVETQCPVNHTILPWEGAGQGTCAAFTANSKLIKQDCDQRLKFICHRKINVPPPCDYEDDWEQLNGYCYKRSTEVHSWHDALVECNMEGASLISITGTLEQQWATDFATEAHDSVWTGLTEEGHPGSFEWIDGNKSNYSHWDEPDQPD